MKRLFLILSLLTAAAHAAAPLIDPRITGANSQVASGTFTIKDAADITIEAGVTVIFGDALSLANGGTGAALTDPNADRLLFWDDSAGAVTWLTLGTRLSITGTTLNAADGFANPMTTAADIIKGGASGTPERLGVGSEGQVLKVVSGALAWAADSTGSGSLPGTPDEGDLVFFDGADWVSLGIGSAGQVLKTNGTADAPVWAGGVGDVVGPSSSTDARLALFDSTTGKLLKQSSAITESGGTLTSNTAIGITAGGSNQDVVLTPSGTGRTRSVFSSSNYLEHDSAGVLRLRRDGSPRPRFELQDLAGNGEGYIDFYTYTSQTVPTLRWMGIDINNWMGEHVFSTATGGSANTPLIERLRVGVNTTAAGQFHGAGLKVPTSGGTVMDLLVSNTASLDFASIAAGASEDLTITVTGAAVGDSVALGLPAAPTAGIIFQGFVSATNTVTVRATNITGSAVDPSSATYRATVTSF